MHVVVTSKCHRDKTTYALIGQSVSLFQYQHTCSVEMTDSDNGQWTVVPSN